jgi:hypothetical protein
MTIEPADGNGFIALRIVKGVSPLNAQRTA